MLKVGTRKQVMKDEAIMTRGGLKKEDLKYNKSRKIVSKKKSYIAKKSNNKMIGGTNYTQYINNNYINKKLLQKINDEIHSKIETLLNNTSNNDKNYNLMLMLHNIWIQDIYNERPYNCYDCYRKLIKNQLLLDKKNQEIYFDLIDKLINNIQMYKNI